MQILPILALSLQLALLPCVARSIGFSGAVLHSQFYMVDANFPALTIRVSSTPLDY